MEGKKMSYDIRKKLEEVDGRVGMRNLDTMEFLQISLPYVMADAAQRLLQSVTKERKPVFQDGQAVWRGVIPEYRDPVTVGMLMDISVLIDELIAAEIINLKIDEDE